MSNRIDKWFIALVVLFLIIRLPLFFYQFNSLALDQHSLRQVQNLMGARNLYDHGMNMFMPMLDMFGTSKYVIMELPLYQYLIAVLYKLFYVSEIFGRLLSIFFTVLSAAVLYLLTKKLFEARTAIYSVLFFLYSPLIIFYSRAIMIEPMEILLFLCSIYCYLLWADEDRVWQWIAATAIGAVFLLIKPLYLVILVPILISLAYKKKDAKKPLLACLSMGIQAILLMIWLHHSTIINNMFPTKFALTGSSLTWYFGRIDQYLNPTMYLTFLDRIFSNITGKAGAIILLLSLLNLRKLPKTVKMWALGSIAYMIIFVNLNWMHDYYQLLLTPIVAILMAVGLQNVLEMIRKKRNSYIFMIIFIVAYYNADASRPFFINDNIVADRITVLQKYVPRSANVIYLGDKLDPNLPTYHYYASTRGLNIDLSKVCMTKNMMYAMIKNNDTKYLVFISGLTKNMESMASDVGGIEVIRRQDGIVIYKII